MASGSQPHTSVPQGRSWSQIASSLTQSLEKSPLHNVQLLNKLKATTTNFIRLDNEAINRGRMKFQYALYGKLFGKAPTFEQVKTTLLDKWSGIGEVFISDLPNGFLLIHCSSEKVMKRLLLEGPWSVNGMILQLSPWKPYMSLHSRNSTQLLYGSSFITSQLNAGMVKLWRPLLATSATSLK